MPVINTALWCSILLLLLVSPHAAIETDSWMQVDKGVSPDSEYLFGSDSMIQAHAKSFCRSKGGTLVIIDSKAEHEMLRNLLVSEGTSNWWINLEFIDVTDVEIKEKDKWFSTNAAGLQNMTYKAFDRLKPTDKPQDELDATAAPAVNATAAPAVNTTAAPAVNATAAPAVTEEENVALFSLYTEHDMTNPNYWINGDRGSAERGPNTNSRNCACLWHGDGSLPYYTFSSVRCHSNRVVTTDLIIKPICEKTVAKVENVMPASTCSYDKFLFPNPDKKLPLDPKKAQNTDPLTKQCWDHCKSNTACVSIDFDTTKDTLEDGCTLYSQSASVEKKDIKDVTENKNIAEMLQVLKYDKGGDLIDTEDDICGNSNSTLIVDIIQNISPMVYRYQGVAWCTINEAKIMNIADITNSTYFGKATLPDGKQKRDHFICGMHHSDGTSKKCTLYKANSKEIQQEILKVITASFDKCDNSNSRDYIVDIIQNISPMACRYQGVAWCTSTEFAEDIDNDYRPGTSTLPDGKQKWDPICGVHHSDGKCTLYKAKSKEFRQASNDVCPGYITSHLLAPDDNFIHCSK